VTLLFDLLLRAYPRAFRARFGDEIAEQAEQECTWAFERSLASGLGCLVATSVDLLRAGLTERWAPTWVDDGFETGREGGMGMMMSHWMRDLGHAARSLRKSPGFTLAAVGTLALALGANAGIFSVVDAVLLRPLPYESPDRLVYIAASAPGSDFAEEFEVSAEFYVHYRDQATQLEGLSPFTSGTGTIRVDDRVERLRQAVVSPGLFQLLGASPAAGRLPVDGQDERVVLISHGLWTTWFGGDPQVIGRTYQFMDGPREIIGVMGPEFLFPHDGTVAWIPREIRGEDLTPGRFGLPLVGRLTPDADVSSLTRELSVLAERLPELYGGSAAYARLMEQHVPVVRSLRDELLGPISTALWVLMGAVAVVLLIACANVASLFTVRAEARGRDLAVRRAIGAGRGALVRAQLAEAVVVAMLAGAGALAMARLALPAFVAAAPDDIPRIADVGISGGTVLFTIVASLLAALLCGLAPAVRASAPDLARLRDGARGSTRGRHWARDGLVVAQTGLALTLLVGSTLLLRSVQALRSVDPGYDTEEILTFQFAPDEAHLTDGPSWARFHLDVMDRIRALPGVERVGLVENVPLDEGLRGTSFLTDESTVAGVESGPRAGATFAGGEYFEAMGIEVLRGRGFTEDDASIPGSVVVSAAAADLLWPGGDPVGQRLRSALFDEWHTVVGVVEDIRQDDLRDDPEAMVYYPLVGPEPRSWALTSPGYVVRTARAEAIAPEIRALIREVAPSAPMYRVHTMEDLVSRSMVQLSFTMLTLVVAAGLALLLGTIGLYGVLSYVVAQRTQEIGVRMALGAEAGRVRRMVVGEGVRVVALGIVLGLGVALLATRALTSLLYGVEPADPWTFVGMSLAMGTVGFLASWIPARRASRVDPIQSMRGV
jgi:putative ABC transport system permease protein